MRFEDLGKRFILSAPAYPTAGISESFVELSLSIVHEIRGPMRLWDFARRLENRLGMPIMPTSLLCDAVKNALEQINDPRLAILATSMSGVGYVFDANDPDAKPLRASR